MKKVITLNLDYAQMSGGITEINRKMGLLDSEFKLAQEQMKGYATETEKVETKISYLSEKIQLQNLKVKESATALKNAEEAGKVSEKQLDKLQKNYLKAQTDLAKLNNELEENKTAFNNAANASDKMDDSMEKNSSSSVDLASKVYLVKEALEKAKEAMMSYVDFSVSMDKVKTIADTSAVSYSKLKQGVYDISFATGKGAKDISNALYECISANVKTEDSLQVTLKAAKLAKAGFTETAVAVDVLTTIMNAYNMSADKATIISDKLIQTQNLGKTTVGEFGDAFGKIAGLAKEAGISLDEILAAVATLTSVNGSASESITALKAALSNIIKPTAEAREEAKRLHIAFGSTALEAQGLSGFMENVKKATNGNTESMAKLFGSVEALNAMLQLTGSGAESFSNNLTQIASASGTTEAALDKMDGSGNKFNASIESIKTSMVKLGDTLSPLIDAVSFFIKALSNVPTPVYVILGALSALLLMVKSVTVAKTAWAAVNATLAATMAILSGSATITAASFSKVLVVIIAIVAVIGLVVGLAKSISSVLSDASKSAESVATQAQQTAGMFQQGKGSSYGYNASGTDNWRGGKTWVGEGGPELIELPRGTAIYNEKDSRGVMGGDVFNTTIVVKANEIQEVQDFINIVKGQRSAARRR